MIDREQYSTELERNYWWFRGRRAILSRLLNRFLPKHQATAPRVLEVGCGTGGNLQLLSKYGVVTGLDISRLALCRCGHDGRAVQADGLHLPFQEGVFDVVVALDLLEHLDDDVATLHELSRVLKKRGVVVLMVPAVKDLWSGHDVALGHCRRYSRKELREKVTLAHLKIQKFTFAISFLFPSIFLFRKAQNAAFRMTSSRTRPAGIVKLPGPLNEVLVMLLKAESLVLPSVSLPFGVSLVCIARKPGD